MRGSIFKNISVIMICIFSASNSRAHNVEVFPRTDGIFWASTTDVYRLDILRNASVFGENNRQVANGEKKIDRKVRRLVGKLLVPGASCTASLVWLNLILTAAHCLADSKGRQVKAGKYTFCLNYNAGRCRDSSIVSNYWYGSINPLEDGFEHDWAILKLEKPLGEKYGFFGVIEQYRGITVSQAGYGYLFFDGKRLSVNEICQIKGRYKNNTLIKHDCDTVEGDSGSPLFVCRNEDCRIVALNVGQRRLSKGANKFRRKYSELFANIAIPSEIWLERLIELRKKNPR